MHKSNKQIRAEARMLDRLERDEQKLGTGTKTVAYIALVAANGKVLNSHREVIPANCYAQFFHAITKEVNRLPDIEPEKT